MTTQFDFSPDEWNRIASLPVLVGLAVAKAEDSGFFGSMRETRTVMAEVAAKADPNDPAHGLIQSVAGTDTGAQADAFKAMAPEALGDAAIAASTEVRALLQRVATEAETESFVAWVFALGQHVADVAVENGVRVSPKEAELLERLQGALSH